MQKKNASIRQILPLLIWMCLIFFFSHQPADESVKYSQLAIGLLQLLHIDLNDWTMGNATLVIRKAAHITEYAILCAFVWQPTKDYFFYKAYNTIRLISFLFCFLYACLDEFHQTFIDGRVGCIQDVGVDSIGVLLMIVFLSWRDATNLGKSSI